MKKSSLVLVLLGLVSATLQGCIFPTEESTVDISQQVLYEVNFRQYTEEGTFNAFANHLDRLKELGVDMLWLMPIHPISKLKRNGTLGSFYSIGDYYDVNPEFGTKEDFKNLVDLAHEKGFKLLLDLVANHTGWDNPWISEHPDWYTQNSLGQIIHPDGTNWLDVADLNYNNLELQQEMINVMTYWVEDFGIDGYRCDYAGGVPQSFWEKATEAVNAVKPIFMLAENDSDLHLLDEAFDANYSFSFMTILKEVAQERRTASAIKQFFLYNLPLYPVGTYPLLYTTNHDVNSWEGTMEDLFGEAEYAMNVITFTMPGMPLIYSGQEVGLDHSLAFFEKDEIDWKDGLEHPTSIFYQQLIELKHANSALSSTSYDNLTFISSSNLNSLCYLRKNEQNEVFTCLNLSNEEQTLTLTLDESMTGTYIDYFSNETMQIYPETDYVIPPWGYHVWIKQ